MSNEKRAALHGKLVGQIRQFIAGVILFNQRVAEHTGLRLSDMQCVNVLELMGPLTAGKLAECTGLSTGGVTVMLDRLEKEGFVKRSPNPNDRRSVLVTVNSKKVAGIHGYYDEVHRQTLDLLAEFPVAELEVVDKFFARLNALRVKRGELELGK